MRHQPCFPVAGFCLQQRWHSDVARTGLGALSGIAAAMALIFLSAGPALAMPQGVPATAQAHDHPANAISGNGAGPVQHVISERATGDRGTALADQWAPTSSTESAVGGRAPLTRATGVDTTTQRSIDIGQHDIGTRGNSAAAAIAAATLDNLDVGTGMGVGDRGMITVHDQGLGALVAPGLVGAGAIQARTGAANLLGGTAVTVDFYGDGLINFAVSSDTAKPTADDDSLSTHVRASGTVYADGNTIMLDAATAGDVVDNAINLDGVIHFLAVESHDGHLTLVASTGRDDADFRGTEAAPRGPATIAAIVADTSFDAASQARTVFIDYSTRVEDVSFAGPAGDDFGTISGQSSLAPGVDAPIAIVGLHNAFDFIDHLSHLVALADSGADDCAPASGGGVLAFCDNGDGIIELADSAPAAAGPTDCSLTQTLGAIRLRCGGDDGDSALPSEAEGADGLRPSSELRPGLQDLLELWIYNIGNPTGTSTVGPSETWLANGVSAPSQIASAAGS